MKRLFPSFLIPVLLILALLAGCKGDANQRKKKFLENGNKSFNKGDYRAAALGYKRALQEDKQYSEAYYRLGLTALKTGAFGDAVSNLQRAFSLDPKNTDAGAKLANIFMFAVARDPRKASAWVTEIEDVKDRLLKNDPKSYDGLRLSAYLAMTGGKTEDALKLYEQANAAKPDQPEVVLSWAKALLDDHQDAEAERLLTSFIQKKKDVPLAYDLLYAMYGRNRKPDEAEKTLRAKADAMPEHPEFRVQLASHYFVNQRRADMDKELNTVATAGKDGEGHLLVGDFFYNLKEYDRSQKEFEAGAALNGKNKPAFEMRIVQLYAVQQKMSEANTLIDQVVKSDPKNNDALGMRAVLQVNSGDLTKIDSAISDLKGMVQRNPENPVIHFQLARAYLAKAVKANKADQAGLAKVELETVTKLRPDYAQAKTLLAQLMVNSGEYGKAVVLAEEVISTHPADLEAHLIRAVAWAKQKEYEKARASLEAILKASPMQQDARFQLGDVYRMEGDTKDALATFREFRKMSPGDPRGWAGIALTMQGAHQYKEAESFLKDELAADPKKEAARFKLAEIYTEDKQYDPAIDEYKTLLKDHPQSSDLHAALADTLRQKGDKPAAIEYFRKAVALKPDSPAPMVRLAMVLEEYDQVAESRALYEKILKLEPDNVIALNNLAFIKAEEGTDIDGALTMAQKAKQQQPGVNTISDTLGWIYIKKNLPDDAIRIFDDLCRKEPDNAMFRYHLAQALLEKGDKLKAKQQLTDALVRMKTHPDQKYEQKIREMMTKLAA